MSFVGDSNKRYGARTFGTVQPLPREDVAEKRDMSANREELLEDLLDIILKHKKEIRKVPIASNIRTAQPWAQARGLVAKEVDLDDDGTPETVVYDRSGKHPYIVNGYKLAPSDYAIRHEYYKVNDTPSKRVRQPMKKWIQDEVYDVTKDPNNPWIVKSITRKAAGNRLAEWDGFSMPSKPKKRASPYAIFSKLISPVVKQFFTSAWFRNGVGITNVANGGPYYYEIILNKIISPITIYRTLYLKLVEQKHYFTMKLANRVGSYVQYKKYIKTDNGKNEFYRWFYDNMLLADKSKLNLKQLGMVPVNDNMINGKCQYDGSDPNDLFVQLIGAANLQNNENTVCFIKDGNAIHLSDVIQNNSLAEDLYNILGVNSNPQYHECKYRIALIKETAQISSKNLLSKAGVEAIMESAQAYEEFKQSIKATGGESFNIRTKEGLNEFAARGGRVADETAFDKHVADEEVEDEVEQEPQAMQPQREKGQKSLDEFVKPQ